MFDHYKDTALRSIFYSRFEASKFGADRIEAKHLLLGIARENLPLINRFLTTPASSETFSNLVQAQPHVEESVPTYVDMPMADETRRALHHAEEEARRLGHKLVTPEHMLFGLLSEKESYAAKILTDRGAHLDQIHKHLEAGLEEPHAAA